MRRGVRQSSLAVLQIIPRQTTVGASGALRSTLTTTGQGIEPGLPRLDRPNAKIPAHKTSAYMINLARGGCTEVPVTPVGCPVAALSRRCNFRACNNEYKFIFTGKTHAIRA
jgi:hypothetical protein